MNNTLVKPLQILLIISLSHFLVDFMIGIWPVYKTLAHLDLAAAGIIYAGSAILGEGMQIVFGRASDRGYRKLLIVGGLLASVSAALLCYTSDYTLLFLLFLTTCLGSGAFHPSAVGMISRLTENKKSLYIAIFSSFGAAGLAASQLVYTSIFDTFNGKTWILAIPALILGAFLLQKKYLNGAETQKSGQPARFRLFLEFFKIPSMRLLYISQVCNQAVAWALIFLLPDILKERGYSDWTVFGGGHLSYVLGGAFLLIPSGYIADKFSSRSVITGASVLGFIFLYTFLLLPNLSDFAVLGLLFCTGAAISIVNPVSIALGNKLQPSHPGMVSAFLMGCVWCVSEAIGPGGGGLLTKIFDEDAPARALMLIGVLFPVGLAAVSQLPQEENQLQEI